jgi:hypothetical protein
MLCTVMRIAICYEQVMVYLASRKRANDPSINLVI